MLQGLIKQAAQRRSERQPPGWRFALWPTLGPHLAHPWPAHFAVNQEMTFGLLAQIADHWSEFVTIGPLNQWSVTTLTVGVRRPYSRSAHSHRLE